MRGLWTQEVKGGLRGEEQRLVEERRWVKEEGEESDGAHVAASNEERRKSQRWRNGAGGGRGTGREDQADQLARGSGSESRRKK
jgi:hypothetical protein